MKRVAGLFAVLFFLPACGPDDVGSGADTADGTAGDGDGDGDGESFTPVPARGISITRVTANHGVNVSIADGVDWVDGNGREARLASGRDTIIRIYHQLDPDWVEREIEARLEVTVGGETHEYTTRKTLVTDPIDTYLDGALWFALPAVEGLIENDATFQVSLWEVEPGGENLTEHPTVAPADGPQLIGFESIPMAMNVLFVPFTWNGRTPSTDDETKMNAITDEIYQTEPIQELISAVDSTQSNGGAANVCNMLQTMQQLWSVDGAPANIYYVGLVDTGASSGVMGCAWINSNVNADVWVDGSIGITATSIVHEIGHDQGLRHVQCDDMGNPAADPDPSYPDHPLGRTLNTGFGIRDYSMYPGDTTTDYMSYCNKRWVSPWTWNKVWPRIQSFTAMASPFIFDPVPVLQFGMYPDGSESWWTALARLDPARGTDGAWVEFIDDGEVVARQPAQVDTLSDDESVWVTVRMPGGDPEAEFDSVRYVGLDKTREARRDEVSFYTQLERYPN